MGKDATSAEDQSEAQIVKVPEIIDGDDRQRRHRVS